MRDGIVQLLQVRLALFHQNQLLAQGQSGAGKQFEVLNKGRHFMLFLLRSFLIVCRGDRGSGGRRRWRAVECTGIGGSGVCSLPATGSHVLELALLQRCAQRPKQRSAKLLRRRLPLQVSSFNWFKERMVLIRWTISSICPSGLHSLDWQ